MNNSFFATGLKSNAKSFLPSVDILGLKWSYLYFLIIALHANKQGKIKKNYSFDTGRKKNVTYEVGFLKTEYHLFILHMVNQSAWAAGQKRAWQNQPFWKNVCTLVNKPFIKADFLLLFMQNLKYNVESRTDYILQKKYVTMELEMQLFWID